MSDFLYIIYSKNPNPILGVLPKYIMQYLVTAWDNKYMFTFSKLEDLKVLRRSPDLLNNAKIVQGQLQLILFNHIWRLQPFWSSDLNNLLNNPSNSPVISAKKMLR